MMIGLADPGFDRRRHVPIELVERRPARSPRQCVVTRGSGDRLLSSISIGIGAGVIAYVLIKMVRGRFREVHPIMYGVAVLFVLYFLRGVLEDWLL
jgi:hypothetical protein